VRSTAAADRSQDVEMQDRATSRTRDSEPTDHDPQSSADDSQHRPPVATDSLGLTTLANRESTILRTISGQVKQRAITIIWRHSVVSVVMLVIIRQMCHTVCIITRATLC